jgi:hypothetical protein
MSDLPTPVLVVVDNPDQWPQVFATIKKQTGMPATVNADTVDNLISVAAPLLFDAAIHGDLERMRGYFTDKVIAQCKGNADAFVDMKVHTVHIHLIGVPDLQDLAHPNPSIRVHLTLLGSSTSGEDRSQSQTWDLLTNAEVMTTPSECKSCGGPLTEGELVCPHCGADLHKIAHLPLAVSQLQLY